MAKINEKLGTDYKLFNYYGAPDADRVIIAIGSINDVASEVVDYLNARGERWAWSLSASTGPSPRNGSWRPSPPAPRRSPSWTGPKSPAPWANPCIWT